MCDKKNHSALLELAQFLGKSDKLIERFYMYVRSQGFMSSLFFFIEKQPGRVRKIEKRSGSLIFRIQGINM